MDEGVDGFALDTGLDGPGHLLDAAGVETGQLLFVGVVLAIREVLRRLPIAWPAESWRILPYAIGGTASFWVIERISGFA